MLGQRNHVTGLKNNSIGQRNHVTGQKNHDIVQRNHVTGQRITCLVRELTWLVKGIMLLVRKITCLGSEITWLVRGSCVLGKRKHVPAKGSWIGLNNHVIGERNHHWVITWLVRVIMWLVRVSMWLVRVIMWLVRNITWFMRECRWLMRVNPSLLWYRHTSYSSPVGWPCRPES